MNNLSSEIKGNKVVTVTASLTALVAKRLGRDCRLKGKIKRLTIVRLLPKVAVTRGGFVVRCGSKRVTITSLTFIELV